MKNKMELTATYLKASKGIVFFYFYVAALTAGRVPSVS